MGKEISQRRNADLRGALAEQRKGRLKSFPAPRRAQLENRSPGLGVLLSCATEQRFPQCGSRRSGEFVEDRVQRRLATQAQQAEGILRSVVLAA